MSVEKVLRSLGEDGADRLADAWHDHEREQRARFDGLAVELEKGTGRATLGLTVSGLTLAGLVAASLYVGMELGALKESTRTLQEGFKELKAGMERLEGRFVTTEGLVRQMDARTQRIEAKQQAQAGDGARRIAEEDGAGGAGRVEMFFSQISKLASLDNFEPVSDPVMVYASPNHLSGSPIKSVPARLFGREDGRVVDVDPSRASVQIDFGRGEQGWVSSSALRPSAATCAKVNQILAALGLSDVQWGMGGTTILPGPAALLMSCR